MGTDRDGGAQPRAPACPFCDSDRTEVISLFGSHASLTTAWCATCRSPFEFLRWRDGKAAPGNMAPGSGVRLP